MISDQLIDPWEIWMWFLKCNFLFHFSDSVSSTSVNQDLWQHMTPLAQNQLATFDPESTIHLNNHQSHNNTAC